MERISFVALNYMSTRESRMNGARLVHGYWNTSRFSSKEWKETEH